MFKKCIVLYFNISFHLFVSTLAIKFPDEFGPPKPLSMFYEVERHAGSKKFEINDELGCDENTEYIFYCEKSKNIGWSLQWRIDTYDIRNDAVFTPEMSLRIICSSKYDNLKISCIASKGDEIIRRDLRIYVTPRPSDFTRSQAKNLPKMLNIYEGNPLELTTVRLPTSYHCIVQYPNRTRTKYNEGHIIDCISTEHHGSTLFCAQIKQQKPKFSYNKKQIAIFDMDIKLWMITVLDFYKHPKESTLNNEHKKVIHSIENDASNSDNDPKFPTKEVVGAIIALLIIAIMCAVVYKCATKKKEQKLLENIYSEPQVLYAEPEVDEQGPAPHNQRTYAYAKVIGIVSPWTRTKTKPNLPPRNDTAPNEYQEINQYTEITNNKAVTDITEYAQTYAIQDGGSSKCNDSKTNLSKTDDNLVQFKLSRLDDNLIVNDMYISHNKDEKISNNSNVNKNTLDKLSLDNCEHSVKNDIYITQRDSFFSGK